MYTPAHFQETDPATLHRWISEHPFGALVTHGPHGLDANHLPFLLRPQDGALGTLHAHVARANPLLQGVADGAEVMVVFRAGDAYISPNWYPSKAATHQQVPTWNYRVVHAHGRLRWRDDEKFVRGVVGRLTLAHEAKEPQPWAMRDAPPDYLERMLGAIVGLEIEITRLDGKAKLSQNKAEADVQGAAQALRARGHTSMADAMRPAK